ncbi:MAG: Vancomycin B-type resistance protein VanW [Firmicutes bacterium ADurb.Bin193]|nr:MAG: Vancomycin B-type resistance protein VanW [Firmicutes bacterium ADurb.Bin193]
MPPLRRNVSIKIPYKIIGLVLVFLIIVSSALAYFSVAYFSDRIYPGVKIGGITVGKLTSGEAYERVRVGMQEAMGDNIIAFTYKDLRHETDISKKVTADFSAAVKAAFDAGRTGDFWARLPVIIGLETVIPLEVLYDEKYIKNEISAFADKIETQSEVYRISEDMKTAFVNLSKGGVIVDVGATYEALRTNANEMVFSDIPVVVKTEFDPDDADLIAERIGRPPVDAVCEVEGNRMVIREHKAGIKVDPAHIRTYIMAGLKVFELPVVLVEPKVTVSDLEARIFADVLGEYTTNYDASNFSRTRNMEIAAGFINGVIIAPGENFSFNEIVGERTYAKGYKDANVYVGGRIEQGVGGGICQVVSTLYSAQLYADLQTMIRHNHLFTVSYLPLGQDATVSWGSIDYSFKNNTNDPIKITASVKNGRHTIRILGTKPDKEKTIKIVSVTVSTKPPTEKVIVSPAVAPGTTVVSQKGQSGAVVDTYNVYLRNGVEEKRVFLHRSSYSPMERIVIKGVSPVSNDIPQTEEEIPADETEQNGESGADAETVLEEAPDTLPAETPTSVSSPEIPEEYLSDDGL